MERVLATLLAVSSIILYKLAKKGRLGGRTSSPATAPRDSSNSSRHCGEFTVVENQKRIVSPTSH